MLTFPLLASLGATVVATSFLSGLFGMAGGMVLMGFLLMMLPVPSAMLLHGITQLTSNGWRAWLWRRHVVWSILLRFCGGYVGAIALFATISAVPERGVSLTLLGLTPFLALAVPDRWALNVERPWHSQAAGFICMSIQLVAGIAGPLLDVFFVRSSLTRQQVIATKAATQVIGHAVKSSYFATVVAASATETVEMLPILVAVTTAIVGTSLSRSLLERMSDAQFRRWSRYVVMGTGTVYLGQGLMLLAGG